MARVYIYLGILWFSIRYSFCVNFFCSIIFYTVLIPMITTRPFIMTKIAKIVKLAKKSLKIDLKYFREFDFKPF